MVIRLAGDSVRNNRTRDSTVVSDLANRCIQSTEHDIDADFLVALGSFASRRDGVFTTKQCNATARKNAFLNSRTSRMQSIFDTSFFLFHVGFGFSTNADNRNATRQLRATLGKFFLVVVAVGLLNLIGQLSDASLNLFTSTSTFDDCRRTFVDREFLGSSKLSQFDVLQLNSKIFADHGSTSQNGNVAKHGFAAITEARGLNSTNVQRASKLINNQQRQRFGVNIFGDDQQWNARLANLFKDRNQRGNIADLLLEDQNLCVFHVTRHGVRTADEVRRNVSLVELHPVNVLNCCLSSLAFFNRDHAVLTDTLKRLSQQFADNMIVVSTNRTDVGDLFSLRDFL